MEYVDVDTRKRTTVLGQKLIGSLENLDLVCIRWEDDASRWACYEAKDNIPPYPDTTSEEKASSDSSEN